MSDTLLTKANDLPIIRHPSTGSGECIGMENAKLKAGQTADWVLPAGAFTAKNPEDNWWEDEETELFVTMEDGEFILLE
jgi:hypothetical protein